MRTGDVLEWLGAAALVAAAWTGAGLPVALLAAAFCLAYFGQCFEGEVKFPPVIKWAKGWRARRKAKKKDES